MTVQICASVAETQHLEREIRGLVINLDNMVDAENRAFNKKTKAQDLFLLCQVVPPKVNTQRHLDFLTKSAYIKAHFSRVKSKLQTAREDHKKMLENDDEQKT